MGTTCLACATSRDTNARRTSADIVVVFMLAYAWRKKQTVEQLMRGLCGTHAAFLIRGVMEAERIDPTRRT